ncbi:MAG: hypothetical protein AAFP82_20955, partial [Bacteroidota bacterium]
FAERLVHPGARISYSHPVRAMKINKERQWRGERSQTRSFHRIYQLSGNFSTFYHPKNTTGLMLFSSLERYKSNKRAWTRILGVSLGYIHTFRNGTTYLSKEDGSFEEIIGQQGGGLLGIQAGLMYNTIDLGKAKVNWYVKANLFIQAPYSNALTLRDFLELGVSLPISKTTLQDSKD